MNNPEYKSNLIDTPRVAGGKDLLGVDRYVKALAKFIDKAQMPTTFAIQGEWGSGKTSLMNQIRFLLCEGKGKDNIDKSKPYYGVWVNIWQYSLMQTPEQILINVIQGVTDQIIGIMHEKYGTALSNTVDKVRGEITKWAKIGAKIGAKTAMGAVGIDTSTLDEIGGDNGKDYDKPEKLQNALAEAIKQCLAESEKNGNGKKGFLFFIDDLDRPDPSVAVQILELLKNVFEVSNCMFLLAIDYDVVVRGLVPKFGELTDKNERAFRSFFDKIIQLPFTMPVSAYKVDNYLKNSLMNIGYYTEEQLNEKAKSQDGEEVERVIVLSEMVENSTGSNPRSMKRLFNSLSLIQIMQEIEEDADVSDEEIEELEPEEALSDEEKVANFGLVCAQIAYPPIYQLIIKESNFKKWDDKTATLFRLPPIEEEDSEDITSFKLEEDWQKVLYRACKRNTYLKNRVINISNLLKLIASQIDTDNDEEFKEKVERLLGVSSVTNVEVADNEKKKVRGGTRKKDVSSIEELYEAVVKREGDKTGAELAKAIVLKVRELFGDYLTLKLRDGGVTMLVKNPSGKIGNKKVLAAFYVGRDGIWMNPSPAKAPGMPNNKRGNFCVMPGEEPPEGNRFKPLPDDYFEILIERFKIMSADAKKLNLP